MYARSFIITSVNYILNGGINCISFTLFVLNNYFSFSSSVKYNNKKLNEFELIIKVHYNSQYEN